MDNIIAKITDKDFGIEEKTINNPIVRYGARGIIINDNGEIAIFHKRLKNEYKLPGGGIGKNENAIEAFHREVMEETGCDIANIIELGLTIEEKSQNNFLQISHVFLANVIRDTHYLSMTQKEQDEGGEVLWFLPDEAYNYVSNSIDNVIGSIYDDKYKSMFMVKRDAMILNYFLKLTKKNKKTNK